MPMALTGGSCLPHSPSHLLLRQAGGLVRLTHLACASAPEQVRGPRGPTAHSQHTLTSRKQERGQTMGPTSRSPSQGPGHRENISTWGCHSLLASLCRPVLGPPAAVRDLLHGVRGPPRASCPAGGGCDLCPAFPAVLLQSREGQAVTQDLLHGRQHVRRV